MKKVIINNRVYQMEKKSLKGLFDIGKVRDICCRKG